MMMMVLTNHYIKTVLSLAMSNFSEIISEFLTKNSVLLVFIMPDR